MATFILLSAIPGSGKSTWAEAYKNTHPRTYIVSSDDLRLEIAGRVSDLSKDHLVWPEFLARILARRHEEGATVIADATMVSNDFRDYYFKQAEGFAKRILVVWNIPFLLAKQRNESREEDKVVPAAVMERMQELFEPVADYVREEYDEVIEIS